MDRYKKCLNFVKKFAKDEDDLKEIINEIKEMANTVKITPRSKESGKRLYLQNGGFTLVDEDDYEKFKKWNWSINHTGYVCRSVYANDEKTKRKRIYLHREIMDTPKHLVCDHANGDRLDNRKSNLRNATVQQNGANRRIHKNNTSQYKGVYVQKGRKKKYRSVIVKDGKRIELGCFYDEKEAAKKYNEAAKEMFGEFARVNDV